MYRPPMTYVRSKTIFGWRSEFYVEYNLDEEDDRWIDAYNGGQNRLAPEKFEMMLNHLEVANAEATERWATDQSSLIRGSRWLIHNDCLCLLG